MTGFGPYTPATIFRRQVNVRTRKYRGQLFVAVDDQAIEFNDIAEFIYRRLDAVTSLRDIAARLADEYGIPEEEALNDSMEFVVLLVDHGIVEAVS
jgi:pyrroloquinoline quinone biosynthesis protein D